MSLIVAAFGFGLVSMSIIAISAVGFTMQFGITNMINLAYGQVMIASAYAAYAVNNAGVSIWLSLPVGAIFGEEAQDESVPAEHRAINAAWALGPEHGIVAAQLRKQRPPDVVLVEPGITDVDRRQRAPQCL